MGRSPQDGLTGWLASGQSPPPIPQIKAAGFSLPHGSFGQAPSSTSLLTSSRGGDSTVFPAKLFFPSGSLATFCSKQEDPAHPRSCQRSSPLASAALVFQGLRLPDFSTGVTPGSTCRM